MIKYEYDTAGNKTNMTTPEGKEIKYTYDVNHRLTQIKAPSPLAGEGGGEGVFSFTYDTSGRRTKLTYPNEVTTTYSYDTAGNLTNLLTQYSELQSQGKKKLPILKLHTLDSFTYTHDKVGNRLTKTEISDTHTDTDTKYSYDTIYRLTQTMPSKIRPDGKEKEQENKLAPEGLNQGAEIFTYDPAGNRLTGPKEKLNYTYNQGNQLTELTKQPSPPSEGGDKGVVYTYDKNGNLTKKVELDDEGQIKKTTLYSYDYENRLIKVEIQKKDKVKIVTFTYDPFGRRLSKSVHREEIEDDDDNGGDNKDDDEHHTPRATYYVYDNEDIIMEYNHKSKVTARYVHGLGIDEPLAVEQKGETYYYHFDGLGSVTALTDAKGKIVQRYDYDSFGKLKRYENKVKNPYTYTAREYDRETGLYYYRARYYDAKVGRFITPDPSLKLSGNVNIPFLLPQQLENPQELNPFVYTLNNSINNIDPTGLSTSAPGLPGLSWFLGYAVFRDIGYKAAILCNSLRRGESGLLTFSIPVNTPISPQGTSFGVFIKINKDCSGECHSSLYFGPATLSGSGT
ncbi:MAG: RHS repeat protein [Nitrospinae bacterium]|nr:RHS repeat protein [Nitrospinota bacterium]